MFQGRAAEAGLGREDYRATSPLHLVAGAANIPVHWSLAGAAAQCICLQLAPRVGGAAGDENSQWSAPLEAALQGGAVCHLALPSRGGDGGSSSSSLELHGARIARGVHLPGG